MLATSWARPFSDPEWTFEVKWDGVRAILYWDGSSVELRSRRGREVTETYPELCGFSAPRPCVLDGEIVAFDDAGRPSFERLQGRMNLTGRTRIAGAARDAPVTYLVFDLLHEGGETLVGEPWIRRRARLDEHPLGPGCVRSMAVEEAGEMLYDASGEQGLEGVVAKRLDSIYRPGVRSADWRKIARLRTVRAVVGGFSRGEGAREGTFGALLVGLWSGERLRYVGAVGTGFDDRTLARIRAALDEMGSEDSPFHADPALPRGAAWVQPRLVSLVEFKQWTTAGRLRAPSFKGLTDDPLETVTWEQEGPTGEP